MLRKLTVLLMAALFSLSVASLSFAQAKPSDKPADKPAEKSAANPCAAGQKEMGKKKKTKKTKPKKKAKKEKESKKMVPGAVEN